MNDDPTSYLDYASPTSLGATEYLLLVVLALAVVYGLWSTIAKKDD